MVGRRRSGRRNWRQVANNSRFLILPWVRVPHLASHILGRVARRIAADWQARYGHAVRLLETFVERDRFRGSCYRAANWICAGQTQGRTRQDRHSKFASAGQGCVGVSPARRLSPGFVSMKRFTREELLPLARRQPEVLVDLFLDLQDRLVQLEQRVRSWKPNWPATVPTAASRPPATA